jgi:hypothetical protein
MKGGAVAAAVTLALIGSGCASERSAPRPGLHVADLAPLLVAGGDVPLDVPDVALSRDALHLRTLSATQALALQHTLRHCLAPAPGAPTARFRACAFAELAHNSISQRLNGVIALTLARRLTDGDCRTSLLTMAGLTRALAGAAEGTLRELNSQPRWSVQERANLLALRALARDAVTSLRAPTWRRDCAPSAQSGGP